MYPFINKNAASVAWLSITMHFLNIVKKIIKKPFGIGILNQNLNYSFLNSTEMFLKYKGSNFTAELFHTFNS